MTTARKLWLGFGILTALLVASSLAIITRVSAIDGEVRDMADARNFSAAAAQLEIDTLGYGLSVRAYLQTGDAAPLKQAGENAAAVDRHLREYEQLGGSDRRQKMAARFAPLWQELNTLGEALLAPENVTLQLDHSRRFFELRAKLETLLDREMQADALASYNQKKDEAFADVQAIFNFALALLFVGVVIALTTSAVVSNAVVKGERRLWANRELLRVTLASIGDAVITTDTRGRVTYLNAIAEDLTGWSNADAAGQALESVFHIVNESTRQLVDNPASRALREGVIVGLANHTVLIAKAGTERPIDDSAAPIRDEQGRIAGVVLVFRDNTDRHRLEQELRQNASDLSEADRRKNEFLAMLAHELRNPLAPISNAVQLIRLSGTDNPVLHSASSMMERQVNQMVRLVDDLLDVSRISRGKIELRRVAVDLVSAVCDALDVVGPLGDSLDHELSVTLPPQPVIVHADPARLAQIIGNLLNNACKFTDRGGRISLRVDCEEGQAVLRVRDNGIGIGPLQLPHVFDLFMQADTSLGRAESGIGIGLALVKNLVKMHGGSVSASSEGLGQGSEFVARLPLSDVAALPAAAAPLVAAPAAPRRILVVDDNRDAATSMAILLEMGGHQTRTAWDGLEAVDLALAWRPDMVLLDLGLPGLNGYEVAQAIRKQPWGERVLLVALTGWGQEEDRKKTHAAGFDAHLVKPASQDSIMKLLAENPLEATA